MKSKVESVRNLQGYLNALPHIQKVMKLQSFKEVDMRCITGHQRQTDYAEEFKMFEIRKNKRNIKYNIIIG